MDRRQFLVRGGAAVVAVGAGGAAIATLGRSHDPVVPGVGSWSELIALDGVAPVHASLLPNGELLMSGTAGDSFPDFVINPQEADSRIQVEDLHAPMRMNQDTLFCAGHAHLADGRLLLVGGQRTSPELGLSYALLFDSARVSSAAWSPIQREIIGGPSWYPTVTRLPDGDMLVISGFVDWGGELNRTVQLFSPVEFDRGHDPWRLLAPHDEVPDVSPTGADYTHTFVLPRPIELDGHSYGVAMVGASGEVFLFDHTGAGSDAPQRFATQPNGRRPAPAGSERPGSGASSVMLADGRILMVGGGDEDGSGKRGLAASAHIYDPERDSWEAIRMGSSRTFPVAILLPDGNVAVVNGFGDPPGDPRRVEIIDVEAGEVSSGPAWPDDGTRGYHNVALLLEDGRILTAAGESEGPKRPGGPSERTDMRLYSPPCLSVLDESERPRIARSTGRITYGEPFAVQVENGPVHRVTLLAPGSMTHSIDMGQRCVVLFDGEGEDGEVVLSGPADAMIAPPGHYMLFVLRRVATENGATLVPSESRIVRLA